MSARKGSSRGKRPASGKKVIKKEDTEDPAITQLKEINEDLHKQNAALKESVNYYHNKLQVIVQHVLDVNIDNYKPASELTLFDIPEADVTQMITNATITPSNILNNYEVRLEELETRLTHLSTELAKLLKLKMKVEKGLNDMQRMYTVEDLKVNAKRLWYDCCSTQVYVTLPETDQNVNINGFTLSSSRPTSAIADQAKPGVSPSLTQDPIPALYFNVLSTKAQSIILTPLGSESENLELPEKKMPGETHIFNMHIGLRSLIIRELSKQKGNANDWRLMATRVGIPDNLIDQWIRMRAPNAMALVMKVWGDSVGATVRMLHRHLVSPQMKAILLAKRISDFYDVD